MTGRSTVPAQPKQTWSPQTITDTYQAAAFTLPDWKPSMPCQYELFVDLRDGSTRRDRYLSNTSEGCAALVASAQIPSAENLPDGPPKPIPNGGLAGSACSLGGESPSADFALYWLQHRSRLLRRDDTHYKYEKSYGFQGSRRKLCPCHSAAPQFSALPSNSSERKQPHLAAAPA
jgi:hypothetical protein